MKIIAIGRNYSEHAKELNNPVPEEPIFFLKPETALLRNNDPFYIPEFSKNIHYEVELIFRICKQGKNISPRFAHSYFDGIGLGIDFTARDLQDEAKKKGLPWTKAKGFDNSAPVSKFIQLSDFSDLKNIPFSLLINGDVRQKGNSSEMIFDFSKIISYISMYIMFKTGDIVFTGTPQGVGPVKMGDRLTGFIGDKKMLDFEVK